MGAIEVWADVLSVPEPGLVIVGLGRRDVSYDLGFPVTLRIARVGRGSVEAMPRIALSQLNDQHGYLRVAARPDASESRRQDRFRHFAPVYGH